VVDVRIGQRVFRRFSRDSKLKLRNDMRRDIISIDYVTGRNTNDTKIDDVLGHKERLRLVRIDDAIRISLGCTQAEIYITSAALIDLAPLQEVMTTSPSFSKNPRDAEDLEPFQDARPRLRPSFIQRPPDAEDLEDALNQGRKSDLEFETARNSLRAVKTRKHSLFVALRWVFNGATPDEIDILYESLGNLAQQSEESKDPAKSPSPMSIANSQSPIDLMKAQGDPMLELLIYRSILVAIHSLTSLDNSDILDSGIGDQIVPFL